MVPLKELLQQQEATRFEQKYELLRMIGRGAFAQVWLCCSRNTGGRYAVKVVDKADLATFEEKVNLEDEISILESLSGRHEGVVQLVEIFEEDKTVYMVMELCEGGDLFELISELGALPEHGAKVIFRQLASALCFCHGQGVVHRDVKPENILIDRPGNSLYHHRSMKDAVPRVSVKLADFGLAVALSPQGVVTGCIGSQNYTAPEVMTNEPYGKEVDVWSLGVVLCFMLTGKVPVFCYGKQDSQVWEELILSGRMVDLKTSEWLVTSDSAKHLLSRMLAPAPSARITAEGVLAHPWLMKEESANVKHQSCLSQPHSTKSRPMHRSFPALHGNILTGFQPLRACSSVEKFREVPLLLSLGPDASKLQSFIHKESSDVEESKQEFMQLGEYKKPGQEGSDTEEPKQILGVMALQKPGLLSFGEQSEGNLLAKPYLWSGENARVLRMSHKSATRIY